MISYTVDINYFCISIKVQHCQQHFLFKGTCICNEDYGAADCSINLRDPPVVNGVNLDSGGLCDKLHCSEAVVEGDLFLDRTTLTCKMQRFNVKYLHPLSMIFSLSYGN